MSLECSFPVCDTSPGKKGLKGEILKEIWSVVTVMLSLLDQLTKRYGQTQDERSNELKKNQTQERKNLPRVILGDFQGHLSSISLTMVADPHVFQAELTVGWLRKKMLH